MKEIITLLWHPWFFYDPGHILRTYLAMNIISKAVNTTFNTFCGDAVNGSICYFYFWYYPENWLLLVTEMVDAPGKN
jgi:hypothetical protein